MIALILTAFGLMLGILKPADAIKHIGTILCIVILLLMLLVIMASAWSAMSLWQQIALVGFGACIIYWLIPRRQPRKRDRH